MVVTDVSTASAAVIFRVKKVTEYIANQVCRQITQSRTTGQNICYLGKISGFDVYEVLLTVSVVSFVSIVSFLWFRFGVSGFSTCRVEISRVAGFKLMKLSLTFMHNLMDLIIS